MILCDRVGSQSGGLSYRLIQLMPVGLLRDFIINNPAKGKIMRHWKSVVLLFVFTALVSWPMLAAGQDQGCNTVTFEGIGDYETVGAVLGPVNVLFGSSWIAIIDSDAPGGSDGDFANEPSESTIAFLSDQTSTSIFFVPAVSYVDFWYTASPQSLPLTATAFDIDGVEVAQDIGNTIGTSSGGADCNGDPNGDFCLWDSIVLYSPGNLIASIQIVGASTFDFGIDDVRYCNEPPVANDTTTWGTLKGSYR